MLTAIAEPRRQKLPLWIEWNENDVNAEKWEVIAKIKDPKAKPTSAPVRYYQLNIFYLISFLFLLLLYSYCFYI